MAQSVLGRFGALVIAASFAQCSKSETLPLITDGDSVRLLSGSASCPAGANAFAFDDSSWPLATLPIPTPPADGACLRKVFDIGSTLPDYRWLDIKLSSGSQAQLNSGKGITSQEEQGLDWTSHPQLSDDPEPVVEYSLDLHLFPSLLQPKSNVLALQVPATRQTVELGATLRRDNGNVGPYVQVVNGPYMVHPTTTSVQLAWETDRSAPSWATMSGETTQRYDGGWSVHHDVTIGGLGSGLFYSFFVATAEQNALPAECQALATADPPSAPAAMRAKLSAEDADGQLGRYLQRRDACLQLAAAMRSTTATVHTALATGSRLKLALIGDTLTADNATNSILAAVGRESADLVVHTGDLVATPNETAWQGFFASAAPMLAHTPIVPVAGERDLGPWVDRFAQLFALDGSGAAGRAYSVDLGVVHLALLDSNADVAATAAWLDADLTAAEAAGARHSFVVMHQGPYSSGRSRGNAAAVATLVPVIRLHHVDAILSGHDNIYERGVADGLSYVVSGGAGARADNVGTPAPTTITASGVTHYVIIDIDGDAVTLQAKSAAGTVFDQVALAP